jgi:hypothetical protein
VDRADQLVRSRYSKQRQRLVYLFPCRQQRREALAVFLRLVRRCDEGVPGALGLAQFCPQFADAVLRISGQGAADGPAQLRDPGL